MEVNESFEIWDLPPVTQSIEIYGGRPYQEHFVVVNTTGITESVSDTLPMYLRISVSICIIVILIVGTIGNTMIALVIGCSRDMRTSTNFFLVNLSVADLLVLILVTPIALLEVLYHPDIWILGSTLCSLIPVLEMIVCHASVLTILAISFERYYAICCPLKANYVCTRARAVWICVIVWIVAVIITSPMFWMVSYVEWKANGIIESQCIVGAGKFWPDFYTFSSIVIFFLVPLIILVITYGIIAHRLTQDTSALNAKNENIRGRRQVVLMLGTVVFTFFLCLLPFRILTIIVLVTDYGNLAQKHTELHFTILYVTRILTYVNSALNPILYNMMSTKFRNGFLRLCGQKRKQYIFHRNGTFLTLTTTTSHPLSLGGGSNNLHNITPHHGPLTNTLSSNPTSTPQSTTELLINNNKHGRNGSGKTKFPRRSSTGSGGGLIRKNGIRKSSTHQIKTSRGPSLLSIQSRSSHRYLSNGNCSSSSTGMILLPSEPNNHRVLMNPKSLSKKFIYSYVSGHKSESML